MKKTAILFLFLILVAGSAGAGFLSPTPGGRTSGTQIGGGQGLPLLPTDAWGWYLDETDTDPWRAEFGTEVLAPKFKIKYRNGRVQESKNLYHVLPFGSLSYRFDDEWVLKLNLDNPFRLGAAFGKNREQLGFDTQSLVSLTTVSAVFDYKLNDQIHLSGGPVIGYCMEKWHAPFDFNRRPIPLQTASEASGLSDPGFTLAAFVNPTERLRLGLQWVSKIEVDLTGHTDIPLLGIRDKFNSHLEFPQTLTLAGSYQVSERLQVVGDVYYWNYSKTSNDQVLDFHKLPLIKSLAIEAKDAFGVHFGANYILSSRWTVRGGVGWLSQSVPDRRLDTLTFDVPGYDVAMGISYKVSEAVSLSASWTHAWGESESHNGDKLSTKINTFGLSGSINW